VTRDGGTNISEPRFTARPKVDVVKIYRCAVDIEVPKGRRQTLVEALANDSIRWAADSERRTVESAILSGRLRIRYMLDEPWEDFERLIAAASCHVHDLVRGVAVEESIDENGHTESVIAEKIVGRRGEIARLPLRVDFRPDGVHVDPDMEDLIAIRERWTTLPIWVQDALRRKYPRTRAW
jgi:hypothetical protein